jgi:hypothetical protein
VTILPKAFFWFLVLVMLASFVGSWQSLSKVHQQSWWPDWAAYADDGYGYNQSIFRSLTRNTICVFDSIIGKIVSLIIIIALSFGCGRLAFRYDYLYTGLLTLMAFAAYCALIAIGLRFVSPFAPVIRM